MSYANIQALLNDMRVKYPQAYSLYLKFQCDEIFESEDKLGMFFSSQDLYDMPFQLAFLVLERRIDLSTVSKKHLGNSNG